MLEGCVSPRAVGSASSQRRAGNGDDKQHFRWFYQNDCKSANTCLHRAEIITPRACLERRSIRVAPAAPSGTFHNWFYLFNNVFNFNVF